MSSKLKWATFFEDLQIPYEANPQAYQDTDGAWYHADFWLPNQSAWVMTSETVGEKYLECELLFALTNKPVYLFTGFPDVMRFCDEFDSNIVVAEVCNFRIEFVNQATSNKCVNFAGTSNQKLLFILGLWAKHDSVEKYRMYRDRISIAAQRANLWSSGRLALEI